MELSAIAAVVIGGTSLTGGRGSVLGTFLGVLVLATLGNGLAQLGVQEPLKRLLTGGVIARVKRIERESFGFLPFWARTQRQLQMVALAAYVGSLEPQ